MLVYLRDISAQTICACCHTEIEVVDLTFHLTRSQYAATGLTIPSADPVTPGAWQGSHWYDSTQEKSCHKHNFNTGSSTLDADALITRPTMQSAEVKTVVGA